MPPDAMRVERAYRSPRTSPPWRRFTSVADWSPGEPTSCTAPANPSRPAKSTVDGDEDADGDGDGESPRSAPEPAGGLGGEGLELDVRLAPFSVSVLRVVTPMSIPGRAVAMLAPRAAPGSPRARRLGGEPEAPARGDPFLELLRGLDGCRGVAGRQLEPALGTDAGLQL